VDYLPFGGIRKQENSGEYENKYKFTGKERNVESGLDYFEARYYNSVSWRFRSIDRVFWEAWATKRWLSFLADPQQLNAYHYARNNPLIYNDPTGEYVQVINSLPKVLNSLARVWNAVHKFWKAVKWRLWTVSINNVWPNLARHRKTAEDLGHFLYKVTHQSKKGAGDKTKPKKEWKSSSWEVDSTVSTPDSNPDKFTPKWGKAKTKRDNFWDVYVDQKDWNIWSKDNATNSWNWWHWWSAWKVRDKWTSRPNPDKRRTVTKEWKILRD